MSQRDRHAGYAQARGYSRAGTEVMPYPHPENDYQRGFNKALADADTQDNTFDDDNESWVWE